MTTLPISPTAVKNNNCSQQVQRQRQSTVMFLLRKGAVEEVHKTDSLGFYRRLFLVPKPGNRWRPVIDLSTLNTFLVIPKFKMETPESIRASLRTGEWVTSIDLTDAYLHMPIHPQSRKFLRFFHRGVSYQFKSLPFGLATAPPIFTGLGLGSTVNGPETRHPPAPISGRLVAQGFLQGGSKNANRKISNLGDTTRLHNKLQEVIFS